MSNECTSGNEVKNLLYRKIVTDDYIGWIAHHPEYQNSTLNNGGFAGVTRVIVSGDEQARNILLEQRLRTIIKIRWTAQQIQK